MSWIPAGRRDIPAIVEFLLPDEALHVPFSSRLRSGARGCDVFFQRGPEGGVQQCLLYTAAGLLLPVLAAGAEGREELSRLLLDLRPPVHSIMGIRRCVDAAEAVLPLPPTTRVEYFLMSLERPAFRPPLPWDSARLQVRRADSGDADDLYLLQKGYELEEVILDPLHFSESNCMRLLKAALKDEVVYVAELDGVPVAKAATNARGFDVDQVGGVYTVPAQRGKGIGAVVVGALLKEVFAAKTSACLFVKKRNRPAIALYDRLGFEPVTDYVISYYGL
jgi:predicted GNAT family acetyltransferase